MERKFLQKIWYGYTVTSMFHHLRFIEAELEDAKGKLLMHEQESKLAEEQLREKERKKAEAVRKSMDLEALCQQREEYVTK